MDNATVPGGEQPIARRVSDPISRVKRILLFEDKAELNPLLRRRGVIAVPGQPACAGASCSRSRDDQSRLRDHWCRRCGSAYPSGTGGICRLANAKQGNGGGHGVSTAGGKCLATCRRRLGGGVRRSSQLQPFRMGLAADPQRRFSFLRDALAPGSQGADSILLDPALCIHSGSFRQHRRSSG